MNFRSFNPGGISVEVTFPRWPLRLAQLLIGLGLVAILLLVGLAWSFEVSAPAPTSPKPWELP